MIYAIGCGPGAVKFGRAKNPHARLADLQVGNPTPLRLISCMEWHDSNERLIQTCFEKERIRGEWYEISARIERFLGILTEHDPENAFYVAMEFIAKEISPEANYKFLMAHGRPSAAVD